MTENKSHTPPGELPTNGISLIAAERRRQVDVEGWTPEHDDEHEGGQLALAAACYALDHEDRLMYVSGKPDQPIQLDDILWPWEARWWKPSPENRVRELVKSGALIAAEIDRLLRIDGNWTPLTDAGEPKTKGE